MSSVFVWLIVSASIAGVLFRPKKWPEAVWACLGAVLLVATGLLPFGRAAAAVGKGTDVYLFLTGMMLLSELARREGLFDWLAALAVSAARGSRSRLFGLIYLVGTVVTVFLSNDATAVVLTPAVYAAVKKARTPPLPYLFICAFIANAASFVLPISNPANLVVYATHLPPLVPWLRTFFFPSCCSIGATYLILLLVFRTDLQGTTEGETSRVPLSHGGRVAAWGIAGAAVTLIAASALGLDLGLPTCIAAVVAVLLATRAKSEAILGVIKGVSWSVLPLVAGLFVLVEAAAQAGAMKHVAHALAWCGHLPRLAGAMAASFGVAVLSNLTNNLPSGLLAGGSLQAAGAPAHIRDAVLVGVDLGPNLSVTGSLATILWLIALRREGEQVSGWNFLKVGVVVMPLTLFLATAVLALFGT